MFEALGSGSADRAPAKPMDETPVDMEALELAWQDEGPDNSYYLDLDSGCIELVQRDLYDLRELTDKIERDRDRYLYVPKPKPGELKQDLLDYIDQVTDAQLARLLPLAMESPHPLASFKAILAKNPDQLSVWEEFRRSRVRIRIKQWLSANFVDRDRELSDFSPPED